MPETYAAIYGTYFSIKVGKEKLSQKAEENIEEKK